MAGFESFWALAAGCVLDLLIGDPHGFPHIVTGMGHLISWLESRLRPLFPAEKKAELAAGALLTLITAAVCTALPALVLRAIYRLNSAFGFAAECFLCCQLLAARSLRDESLRRGAASVDRTFRHRRRLLLQGRQHHGFHDRI